MLNLGDVSRRDICLVRLDGGAEPPSNFKQGRNLQVCSRRCQVASAACRNDRTAGPLVRVSPELSRRKFLSTIPDRGCSLFCAEQGANKHLTSLLLLLLLLGVRTERSKPKWGLDAGMRRPWSLWPRPGRDDGIISALVSAGCSRDFVPRSPRADRVHARVGYLRCTRAPPRRAWADERHFEACFVRQRGESGWSMTVRARLVPQPGAEVTGTQEFPCRFEAGCPCPFGLRLSIPGAPLPVASAMKVGAFIMGVPPPASRALGEAGPGRAPSYPDRSTSGETRGTAVLVSLTGRPAVAPTQWT